MEKFANLYLTLVLIILYIPVGYPTFHSFNQSEDMDGFTGFTLEHYSEMFTDSRSMLTLIQTFFLAFLSSILATAIGAFGAIFIYQARRKHQHAIPSMNNILMVTSDVMIGASFLILFTRLAELFHFNLGFMITLPSHTAFSILIVVLMVSPCLKEMNDDIINAAYGLGATPWQMLKEVMLSYLTSRIISDFFMAFIYSLDDFAVAFFVTGNSFSTPFVKTYSRARRGISLEINALSTIIFLFSILLVIGYYFISQDKGDRGT